MDIQPSIEEDEEKDALQLDLMQKITDPTVSDEEVFQLSNAYNEKYPGEGMQLESAEEAGFNRAILFYLKTVPKELHDIVTNAIDFGYDLAFRYHQPKEEEKE